jgi:dynein heavy chain
MLTTALSHWLHSFCAALDQWEREVQLYIALKQLALFRQHKLWKAFKSWKHSIDSSKISAAKASLNKQLFMLSPVFQGPLQRFHQLCHELSSMRVHNLKPAQVGRLLCLLGLLAAVTVMPS